VDFRAKPATNIGSYVKRRLFKQSKKF